MNVLDLFSGIGGFSLGLERAGMRTVAFCEIDPFCQAILRKHWPNVPLHGDIRELTIHEGWLVANSDERHKPTQKQLQPGREGIRANSIDVICGGFPCQDISVAGKGAGIEGSRSGLWSEYARIIGEIRPRYVIVENVAALLGRGLERVLGDLAALGFDAEWHCIPAYYVGVPQTRDRIWIVANDPSRVEQYGRTQSYFMGFEGKFLQKSWNFPYYAAEPNIPRVADRISNRFHRISGIGNAVVPQIPEIIGRAIMEAESRVHAP